MLYFEGVNINRISSVAKLHQVAHKEDIISVTKNLDVLKDPLASELNKHQNKNIQNFHKKKNRYLIQSRINIKFNRGNNKMVHY